MECEGRYASEGMQVGSCDEEVWGAVMASMRKEMRTKECRSEVVMVKFGVNDTGQ
jgi:hypothetical protein